MSNEQESIGRGRVIAGVLASVLWLALWALAIWGDYAAGTLVKRATALTVSEWSAIVAAIIAPIGVLWLVVGYFQQAAALARNTVALRAQQRALSMQTEQSTALVNAYARQAAAAATLVELELAAHRRHEAARRAVLAPDFRFADATFSAGHRMATFAMVNTGGTVYALRFQSDDFAEGRIKPAEVVERNAGFSVHLNLDPMLQHNGGMFTIGCRDIEGREHALSFRVEDGAVVPVDAPSPVRRTEPLAG